MDRNLFMRLGVKTAVVSRSVPPMIYGTGARVFRLFRHVNPDDYCIVTSGWERASGRTVEDVRLPCPYYMLPSEWRRIPVPQREPFRSAAEWFNIWLRALQRARNTARALRGKGIEAVVTFSGDLEDIPAAFLASRAIHCRFYVVLDDDYIDQWPDGYKKRYARQVESLVLKRADGLFVISEYLGEVYKRRCRRSSRVLHTATLDPVPESPAKVGMGNEKGRCDLVFTGSVYAPSIGALPAVLTAMSSLSPLSATLHLYCSQTEAELRAAGISGPFIVHGSVGPEAIRRIQQQADILLVTFGFHEGLVNLCRTSFPSKMADYLTSGRPILCVAPTDSYLASYIRTNRCGHLVDCLDPRQIQLGILRLVEDDTYRLGLVRNAYGAARRDCDCVEVVRGFAEGVRSTW